MLRSTLEHCITNTKLCCVLFANMRSSSEFFSVGISLELKEIKLKQKNCASKEKMKQRSYNNYNKKLEHTFHLLLNFEMVLA